MNPCPKSRAILVVCAIAIALPLTAAAQKPAANAAPLRADAWPREVQMSNATTAIIYQPQIGQWAGDRIDFRAAVAIRTAGRTDENFGVVFASARTKVDKSARTVVIDRLEITKSDFPTLPDHGAAYSAELGKRFASAVRVVALDQLKASPALAASVTPPVAVQNTPPTVIVSYAPAILVPIDGAPALRPVPGSTQFLRVINTRALILQRAVERDYFIHVFDGWLYSASLDGPWAPPFIAPDGIDAVAKAVAATHVVDMLDGGTGAKTTPSLAKGVPAIYTSQVPAELVVFNGQPQMIEVPRTALLWAGNTASDVLVSTADKNYYVVLAGRWFRAATLNGPWTFVAADALPPDFAKIPAGSPAGVVLQTVAGTPQARQARNENSIAQTATVPKINGPVFTPKFDGAPKFTPIAGTTLTYAINASAPVIQVAQGSLYAVSAGVWFTAAQVTGPWTVATSVPDAIYAIPPSSPVYYVTFVRIFDVTPDAVHEGYTPGYLGTAVSDAGTVVYGTGYAYPSWIGDAWYSAPATYGVAAMPIYNRNAGFTFAFAVGLATPAWTQPYWGNDYYHPGYWGGYPCCATVAANVYRHGNGTPANTNASAGANGPPRDGVPAGATPPPAPEWQPASRPNNVYASANGNVYQQNGKRWQQQSPNGWGSVSGDASWVDKESQARANAGVAAASFGMSNMDRFNGAPNTGWTARDAGDGGYSRTLGGSGGIGAEYDNYWNGIATIDDAPWGQGAFGSGNLYYSGFGWSGRFPVY